MNSAILEGLVTISKVLLVDDNIRSSYNIPGRIRKIWL